MHFLCKTYPEDRFGIRTPPLREPQPDAARSPTDGEELRNRLSVTEPSRHELLHQPENPARVPCGGWL